MFFVSFFFPGHVERLLLLVLLHHYTESILHPLPARPYTPFFFSFRQIILNCTTKRYERKSKAMVKFLSEQMPDYVARVTAGSYDTWEAKPGAKVVLFSKKKEAPSALKALSTKYVEMMTHPFWVSLTRGHTNGVR